MKKILVAISGGVDSAVASFLLKQEDSFEVETAFMKLFSNKDSEKAEKRARIIAKNLNLPFHVFNFEKEFKKEVIDYFIKSYKEGETPNPCVVCNKKMKFGLFLKRAQELKMDYIATGHYVIKEKKGKLFQIRRGEDRKKDQSYFLWGLNQKQLKQILFPLGKFEKEEIKRIAKEQNIVDDINNESQNICFINQKTQSFLREKLNNKPGKIINKKGEVLGKHDGLWFYTIGQRKGIKLSGGPFYVFKKDFQNNNLIVVKDKEKLMKKEINIKNVNWVSEKPELPLQVKTQIRYQGEALVSRIIKEKNDYLLKFKKGQKAVSSGQSAVFYQDDLVLGGGVIKI
jgi:tRNA-specific 2-thiouridylase